MKKIAVVLAAAMSLAAAAQVPFKIGMAGFTFCRQNLDKALATMKKIDCHYLCHKDFFVKYNASDAEIAAYKKKIAAAGVEALATGPLYADNEEAIRRQFEFAKKMGIRVLVGVPFENDAKGRKVESDKVLDIVDKLVKEYDMFYAIHNHGPDMPELYPTAEAALKRIGNRDRRIGVCLDIGHEKRFGCDPEAFIRKHCDRIYDIHLKNVGWSGRGKKELRRLGAKEGPRGVLDIPGIFAALAECGYTGVCHIEYEKDFADNAMGLAESFGYYRGCADSVKAKLFLAPAPEGANTLTPEEKADGWKLLWDGKSGAGWTGVKEKFSAFPRKGWKIENGTLSMLPVSGISEDGRWVNLPEEDRKLGGGGDIVTVAKYRDFALKFDFRMTRAANSGVKYFYDESQNKGSCEEYQILDPGHPDFSKGRDGNRQVAALYDLFPAKGANAVVKPLGQWNSGMIVAKGAKVEHWLNGVKVLEYERGGAAFRAAVGKSKYKTWGVSAAGKPQPWGEIPAGRILLQDHGDSTVAFCNIKIKEL